MRIEAGDFPRNRGAFVVGGAFIVGSETILFDQLDTVEEVTRDNYKAVCGTLIAGAAGAALLGPLGLLTGVLAGGNRKRVTFRAVFKDGRSMLAEIDAKTFGKMRAAIYK